MFVPQRPDAATTENGEQNTTTSASNDNDAGVNNMNNEFGTMNGHVSGEESAKNDDMMANNNNTTTAISESENEGIEISSLISTTTNDTNNASNSIVSERLSSASATEYDMALHGASSNSTDEEEEDTMYQCQMWTASFPDDNNNNNNDDHSDGDNNNISEGVTSAFATLGGGDIWSTEAFALPSPLHDLLASNTPLSLSELLAQDELLQELRGCEVKLVEYFSREEVVAELVECVFGEVPYEGEVGGRERWCDEERRRRELRQKLRDEKKRKKELEEEEEDGLHPNPKLLVSSPRENGEEPNVETQWISPAGSPDKEAGKKGGGGVGWLLNRDDEEEEEDGEEQRTPEEEYDLRFIRYPYMACEVLCSEVGTTLDVLVDAYIDVEEEVVAHDGDGDEGIMTPSPFVVEEYEDVDILNKGDNGGDINAELPLTNPLQPRDNEQMMFQSPEQTKQTSSKKRILDLIFSVLIDTPPSSLDDRRAGYLEKLLVVLFRRRSQSMADYMNTPLILTSKSASSLGQTGLNEQQQSPNAPPMLMCALLDHIHSHSIMHVLQRLLVPSPQRQQMNSKENGTDTNNSGNEDVEVLSSDSDDDNPFSATNNDFMNAINQMNGNQQMGLHDMDDEDVDDEDDLENDLTHLFQCDWSERPDCVLALLLDRLEGKSDSFLLEYGFPVGYSSYDSVQDSDMENDVAFSCSQHAAEILVTIIQNSSLASSVMISISSDPALKRVLDIASLSKSEGETSTEQHKFVPHDSKMTCAITVLESLVLQLGGYGAVGVDVGAVQSSGVESSLTNLSEIGPHAPPPLASPSVHPYPPEASKADTSALVSHLPALLNELSSLLTHPVTKTWLTPAQYTDGLPRPLLGTSRLRILRLVEALVLLGDASVDFDLQHSNILKHCIDLFWEFEWCSMLHQSVANFVVHVFEGGEVRSGLQEYFLHQCQLIERLVDSFESEETIGTVGSASDVKGKEDGDIDDDNSSKNSHHDDIDAVAPVSEEDIDSAMEQENDDESSQHLDSEPIQGTLSDSPGGGGNRSKQTRKGYMGHVIIICQALAHASTNTGDVHSELVEDDSNAAEMQPTASVPKLHSSSTQQEGIPVEPSSKPSQINLILQQNPLLFDKWQQFASTTLAFEMSVQSAPLGGQPMNGQGEPATASDSLTQLTAVTDDTSDDFSGEPSGHLIFGGNGTAVGVIDMDDNDLDIAVSMMEHLSLPSANGESDNGQSRGHNRRRAHSKESNLGHNFGSVIPTTTEFKDYIYDDPLGGVHTFDNEDENEQSVGDGSGDEDIMSDAMVVPRDKETESTSSDESSVEDDNGDDDDDDDVPVMDLFAGNVAFENDGNSFPPAETDGGWANFDSFGADLSQKVDSPSKKSSNGEDPFSFSKTPFDFVDTLEDGE